MVLTLMAHARILRRIFGVGAVQQETARPGHYGLRGMRERAKLLGGKFAVWSERDSGTELELRIPASRAYEKGNV
jgi:nitrate/nitrite-specific signal transduction histidine kinase